MHIFWIIMIGFSLLSALLILAACVLSGRISEAEEQVAPPTKPV